MTFGEKLKQLRAERGLSAKELSKRSGITAVSISNYENGHHKPSVLVISKLAKALDCDYDTLYNCLEEE